MHTLFLSEVLRCVGRLNPRGRPVPLVNGADIFITEVEIPSVWTFMCGVEIFGLLGGILHIDLPPAIENQR